MTTAVCETTVRMVNQAPVAEEGGGSEVGEGGKGNVKEDERKKGEKEGKKQIMGGGGKGGGRKGGGEKGGGRKGGREEKRDAKDSKERETRGGGEMKERGGDKGNER